MRHVHFEGFSRAFLGNACVRPSRLTCAMRSFACHSGVERSGASSGSFASSGSGCSLVTDGLHRKSKELVAHLARRPAVHGIFAQHHDLGRVRAANWATLLLFAFSIGLLSKGWRRNTLATHAVQLVTRFPRGINHVDDKRKQDCAQHTVHDKFRSHFLHLTSEVACHG